MNQQEDKVLTDACGIGQPVPTVNEICTEGTGLFSGYLPHTGTGQWATSLDGEKPGFYYEAWVLKNRVYFVVCEGADTKVYPQGVVWGQQNETA